MDRAELTARLNALPNTVDQTSNIKFHKLLVSRMAEENIPLADAQLIAGAVEYDFSNVPEDNDSLGEFASAYALYADKLYRSIKLNMITDIKPLLKLFNQFKLEISAL